MFPEATSDEQYAKAGEHEVDGGLGHTRDGRNHDRRGPTVQRPLGTRATSDRLATPRAKQRLAAARVGVKARPADHEANLALAALA